MPVSSHSSPVVFTIDKGEGFIGITNRLEDKGLIKSPISAQVYLLLSRNNVSLKPGDYELYPSMTPYAILRDLISGPNNEVKVTIPEGYSLREIDETLSSRGVFASGELISYSKGKDLEGTLFPDTYMFYKNSGAESAAKKMIANFESKTAGLLSGPNSKNVLILASMLEKEVPGYEDKRIVAGILKKRLADDMLLQVDATVCYAKNLIVKGDCYPITQSDLQMESPYNTYVNKGYPIGPISNPGLDSIKAALDPKDSEYWYYLSDPATKRTIFSETLDKHNSNRVKYLLNSQ